MQILFRNEGWVYIILANFLGSQYLIENIQTSLTVKNSENLVKNGCFEKDFK